MFHLENPPGQSSMADRISFDPHICNGRASVAGTRVMVSVVLDNLAEGLSAEEICASYPPLTIDDVRACVSYAAALARDEVYTLAA